jgi:truncated hemoglobin YjbI
VTAGPAADTRRVAGPAPIPARTWYDRVGPERIEPLLTEFCIRILLDERLSRHVLRLDLRVALRNHLRYLLLILLNGPQPYDRRDYLWQQWRRRYACLGITAADVDLIGCHIAGSMRQVGVEEEVVRYLIGRVRPWRDALGR